ncbi:MAG: hypothetical protein ABIE25_07615 [Thermoplasmatota archaeon]|nr:hypothetical protein [Candidatus Thermoplasmatota archaeon]MBU1914198.1 hypothetical protein [Candidatus Thermoplasmatota archaeon]
MDRKGMPKYKMSKRIVDGLWDLFVFLKYPKLVLLASTSFLAGGLFTNDDVQSFFHSLGDLGYLSALFGGMLFAFGFGAPFGVAILATIADDVNIFIAAVIGGLGALASDYLLFKFIRMTFNDEIERFKNSKMFGHFHVLRVRRIPPKASFYISAGIAGIVIASPLPDEFGVAMLAGLTTMRERTFAVICFVLNTLGILTVFGIGLVV